MAFAYSCARFAASSVAANVLKWGTGLERDQDEPFEVLLPARRPEEAGREAPIEELIQGWVRIPSVRRGAASV